MDSLANYNQNFQRKLASQFQNLYVEAKVSQDTPKHWVWGNCPNIMIFCRLQWGRQSSVSAGGDGEKPIDGGE